MNPNVEVATEVCPECNGTGEGFTLQRPCATCGAFMTRTKTYPGKWEPDLSDPDRYVYQYPRGYMNRHERRARAKDRRRKGRQ